MTLTPDLRKRIIRLIDRRLDVRLPDRLTTPLTGQVEELVPSTRTVLVRLDGSSAPVPVHLPMMPGDPVAGARVSVDRTVPGGTLVLDKVLDRDRDTSLQIGRPAIVIRAGGDGVDDAPAFRTAVEAAAAGTIIHLPDPLYLFKSKDANGVCVPITRSNITFVGRGTTWQGAATDTGDGTTTAIVASGGASGGTMFQWRSPDGGTTKVTGGGMRDLSVYGGAVASYGIELQMGVHHLTFANVHVSHCPTACIITGTGSVAGQYCSAHLFEHVMVRAFNTSHGIHLTGYPGSAGGDNSFGIRLIGCDIQAGDGDGIRAEDCDDVFVYGSQLRAWGTGASVRLMAPAPSKPGGGARNVMLVGCYGSLDNLVSEGNTTGNQAARMSTLHGWSTEDRAGAPTIGAGAHIWYDDDQGRHNRRRDLRASVHLVDDFATGDASSTNVGELGWQISGGTVSVVAGEAGHPGIRRLATGAVSGTLAVIGIAPTNGLLIPSDNFICEWIFRLTQVDANTTFRLGLLGGWTGDPPTNGIYLERLNTDTNLFAVCRSGGSQTRTALISPPVAGTWYRVVMRRINNADIGFSVGDVTNWSDTVKITGNVPTAAMVPAAQIKNHTAANKTVDFDAFALVVNGLGR